MNKKRVITAKARQESLPLMEAVAMKAPVKKRMERDFTSAELEKIRKKTQAEEINNPEKTNEEIEMARSRRERVIKIKKIAKEMEKGNKAKIIVFPSYSRNSDKLEWYKMGGFSALYYVYRMADRMGRTAKLMRDTDKFAKMDGIASVRDVEKFLDKAMQLNEFERYEQTLDGFYILYLKKPLTDEEVGVLRRTEEMRHEMMHNVLRPKKADAAVYQAILMLDRQALPRLSKMEKGYYQTIGDTMAKEILEMTKTYFRFANGYIDMKEVKEQLLDLIEGILAGIALLGENNVWGYDVATSIGENTNNLKRLIKEMK